MSASPVSSPTTSRSCKSATSTSFSATVRADSANPTIGATTILTTLIGGSTTTIIIQREGFPTHKSVPAPAKLSPGAIAGISIGSVACVLTLFALLIFSIRRRIAKSQAIDHARVARVGDGKEATTVATAILQQERKAGSRAYGDDEKDVFTSMRHEFFPCHSVLLSARLLFIPFGLCTIIAHQSNIISRWECHTDIPPRLSAPELMSSPSPRKSSFSFEPGHVSTAPSELDAADTGM